MKIQQVVIGAATRRFAGLDGEATTSLQFARVVGVARHAAFYHVENTPTLLSAGFNIPAGIVYGVIPAEAGQTVIR